MNLAAGLLSLPADANILMQCTRRRLGDDTEAFFVTFKQVTTVAQWPPEHRAIVWTAYPTGPAQAACQHCYTVAA